MKNKVEPCKTCGTCPTCGRGPAFVFIPPVYIQPAVQPQIVPYWQQPWYGGGTFTVSGALGSGMTTVV